MKDKVLLDDYVGRVGEKYTFAGVLVQHYEDIFPRCNLTTRNGYNAAYNAHILPLLKDKPIEDITLEDYQMVIETISCKKSYGLATINHFRYLIRTVVQCAVRNGYCNDVLFGSMFSITDDDGEENEKKLVRLKKSLSIKEEMLLCEHIMLDPYQDGGRMGLTLMFCLGVRNNEACAMKFSAIREMESCKGMYAAWIIESTEGRTNNSKAGGKTANAPRKIPVPSVLLKFLQQRKQYLQTLINNNEIILDEGKTVEDLPIVSKKDFKTQYTSEELSAVGRLVLREICLNEDQLAYIDKDLQNEERRLAMGVFEKDPTAYLLRRNFATHLYIQHLNEPEIQYIMGHNMEDSYANRHDYSSEEQLVLIARKMSNRPLLNDVFVSQFPQMLSQTDPNISCCDTPALTLQTKTQERGVLLVQAHALEPSETINVSVFCVGEEQKDAKYYFMPKKKNAPRTVNIVRIYQEAYAKAKNRIKKKCRNQNIQNMNNTGSKT